MVQVMLVGPIGEAAGERSTEADASSLGELIDLLSTRYGDAFSRRVRASRITVNGSPVQFLKGRETPLASGDEVAFLVPVGGG